MRVLRSLSLGAALLLAACVRESAPPPDPLALEPPPPPVATAGEIRIFGHALAEARARDIRAKLRATEPKIVREYERILAGDPFAAGRLQLRIGINREGEVAEIAGVENDVNNESIEQRIPEVVRDLRFGPGEEAYAFYTLVFQPDPFEVLTVEPRFDADPPSLTARILNRSAFRLSDVSVTVRVQAPEQAAPLRISRRRIRAEFPPGDSRTLHVPVGTEWASDRYSFLVDVRPALDPEEDREP